MMAAIIFFSVLSTINNEKRHSDTKYFLLIAFLLNCTDYYTLQAICSQIFI